MAKVARPAKTSFHQRIHDALTSGLETAGVKVDVLEIQPVRNTKLNRVTIIGEGFEHMEPSERQDLVWRVITRHFTPDEQLRISMIYTLTPEEAVGA